MYLYPVLWRNCRNRKNSWPRCLCTKPNAVRKNIPWLSVGRPMRLPCRYGYIYQDRFPLLSSYFELSVVVRSSSRSRLLCRCIYRSFTWMMTSISFPRSMYSLSKHPSSWPNTATSDISNWHSIYCNFHDLVLRYTSPLSKYQDTDHTLHGTENIPLIQSTIDPHPHSSSPESSNRNLFTILISAPRPRKIPISSPLKFSPVLPVFTIQGGIWNPSSKFDTLYLVATPSRTLSLMRPYVQCLGQKWTTDRRGLLLMTPRVDEWRRTSNACNKSQFIWLETTFDRFMISSMPLINILLMKINPRISF